MNIRRTKLIEEFILTSIFMVGMALAFCLIMLTTHCRHTAPNVKTPASDAEQIYYDLVAKRAITFLDRGFVVTKKADGSFKNQGDSLIFTGLLLYGLDCARGNLILPAIIKMIKDRKGGAYRHPDLPDEINIDGLLGLYRGLAKRVTICGDDLIGILQLHNAWVDRNKGILPVGFDFVEKQLTGQNPTASHQAEMEAAAVAWATGVVAQKAACYRIHLGLISMQTAEELGRKTSDEARTKFCFATKGIGMPTVENWCGRSDLSSFIDDFSYNTWQYRHQRCGTWESPDGDDDIQPGIDYLVAYSEMHGSPK